jgi:RNA polymerase-binding protein DksA
MNPGGIRASLDAGDVTWGDLYSIQPFNNYLVKMGLTGQQIYDLLNQQYAPYQPYDRMLQISGSLSDDLDKANYQSEMDFAISRLLREEVNKTNIIRALQKIDEGNYGICEECEEEISIKRLRVIPDATYCLSCQTHLEEEKALLAV